MYLLLNLCTVFHRSIAAATNYFVLQVPEATIRGRRLFEGGVNKFIHTKLPCSSSVGALFSTAYSFKLECSIIRPFLRRHFRYQSGVGKESTPPDYGGVTTKCGVYSRAASLTLRLLQQEATIRGRLLFEGGV